MYCLLLATTTTACDESRSSVGVIVAVVVAVIEFIIITVVMVGIIVVWKKMKSDQHTKPVGVYCSTIDKTIKPEPLYTEMMNDGEDSKEPQYMDISKTAHSSKQADKVAMQNNPAYSTLSGHQVKIQDNPTYSVSSGTKQ